MPDIVNTRPVKPYAQIYIFSFINSKIDVTYTASLFVISASVYMLMSITLAEYGTFDVYDIFFNADPNLGWATMALGQGGHEHGFRHLHFDHFFAPFVGAAAKLAVMSGLVAPEDELATRMSLGLAVVPTFAAVKAAAMYATLRILRLSPAAAFMVAALGAFTFSQLVFGSVPDHFGVSGALIAVLYLQAAASMASPRYDRLWIWGALGFLIAGVTITNLVAFAIIYFSVRLFQTRNLFKAIWAAGGVSATVCAVAVTSSFVLGPLLGGEWDNRTEWVGRYLTFGPWEAFNAAAVFPAALFSSFAPFQLYEAPLPPDASRMAFHVGLGYPTWESLGAGAVIAIVVIGGAFKGWTRGDAWRAVILSAFGICAFNGLFHAVWGMTYFLYSPHWQAALVLLVAGWLSASSTRLTVTHFVFALVAAAAIVASFMAVWDMMALVGGSPAAPFGLVDAFKP